VKARYPGYGDPIIETQDELETTGHHAPSSLDDPDHVRWLYGHEVDQGDGTACCFKHGLQHQAVVAILTRGAGYGAGGGDAPPPVLPRAQECREASRAVEARQAQPVYRAVVANQCSRVAIADQCMIFYSCHALAGQALAGLVRLSPNPLTVLAGAGAAAAGGCVSHQGADIGARLAGLRHTISC